MRSGHRVGFGVWSENRFAGFLVALALAACGQLSHSASNAGGSHGDGGGDAEPASNGLGATASDGSAGAPAPSATTGGASAVTAGTTSAIAAGAAGGVPSDVWAGGAAADYPAVALCIPPDAVPDTWGADGTAMVGSTECPLGVLGDFIFDGCRYALLSVTPFDVDPFLGNVSPCCYQSKLQRCP